MWGINELYAMYIDFFMESADVRYLRTSLFSKRTSEALRASEFCENKLVRKYRTKALSVMKFVYYIQIEIFLQLKMIYLNCFNKYPCSFESFLNDLSLQKSAL